MTSSPPTVMLNLFQHPWRHKGWAGVSCPSLASRWTLKQVQGDGIWVARV